MSAGRLLNAASLGWAGVLLTSAALDAADRQWLHAILQCAGSAYLAWFTTAGYSKALDAAFLFRYRHHRSCIRVHPDMPHDTYVTEFLPFYATALTARREGGAA